MTIWKFMGVQLFRVQQGVSILTMFLPLGFFYALQNNFLLLVLYLLCTVAAAWFIGYVFQRKDVLKAHYKALKDSTDAQWVKKDDMLFERLEGVLKEFFDQLMGVLKTEAVE